MASRIILSLVFILLTANMAIGEQKKSASRAYSYEGLVDPYQIAQEWELVHRMIVNSYLGDAYYRNKDPRALIQKAVLRIFILNGSIVGYVYEDKGILKVFSYHADSNCYTSMVLDEEAMQMWITMFREYFQDAGEIV